MYLHFVDGVFDPGHCRGLVHRQVLEVAAFGTVDGHADVVRVLVHVVFVGDGLVHRPDGRAVGDGDGLAVAQRHRHRPLRRLVQRGGVDDGAARFGQHRRGSQVYLHFVDGVDNAAGAGRARGRAVDGEGEVFAAFAVNVIQGFNPNEEAAIAGRHGDVAANHSGPALATVERHLHPRCKILAHFGLAAGQHQVQIGEAASRVAEGDSEGDRAAFRHVHTGDADHIGGQGFVGCAAAAAERIGNFGSEAAGRLKAERGNVFGDPGEPHEGVTAIGATGGQARGGFFQLGQRVLVAFERGQRALDIGVHRCQGGFGRVHRSRRHHLFGQQHFAAAVEADDFAVSAGERQGGALLQHQPLAGVEGVALLEHPDRTVGGDRPDGTLNGNDLPCVRCRHGRYSLMGVIAETISICHAENIGQKGRSGRVRRRFKPVRARRSASTLAAGGRRRRISGTARSGGS